MNKFLEFRKKVEHNISNEVKNSTGNDLFDWVNIVLFGSVSFLLGFSFLLRVVDFPVFITSWVLWFTAFVVLRYTKETHYLKKLAQKQNITNIRPYLRLQKKAGENKLQLVNEGKGVAVNLQSVYKGKEDKRLLSIPAMAAAPGSITESFIPKNLGLELDPSIVNYSVEITYTDIEKRKYIAVFRTNINFNDGFAIIKQEEVKNEK